MVGRVESEQLVHQLRLDRKEDAVIRQCLMDIDEADALVSHFIRKTAGVRTKARYREIRKYLREQADALGRRIAEDSGAESLIEWEYTEQKRLWGKYLSGSGLNLVFPALRQVVSAATFAPYTATGSFETYLDGIASQYFSVWDANVRVGYIAGITTDEIVRNVVGYGASGGKVASAGAMHSLRLSVERNTRTALQAMANGTRRAIYERNESVFSGYRWLGTLDTRTCRECGALDGKVMRHITDFEHPPLHYNCRCIIVPQVEGYDELGEDTRASETGETTAATYSEWVRTLDAGTRKELGI